MDGGLIDVLAELRAALADGQIAVGDAIEPRHLGDWMVISGADDRPAAVVYPRSTAEVSAILRICHAHRRAVVPQGGLTGLVGGATPVRDCILLSLERMRAIEEIDSAASAITVQAGVPLQAIQEAADAQDLMFPLDIGARGSCRIGGNIATNAGGNRVLRYGMTRELVLGVEAVLADGTVVSALHKVLKHNAGYDLKHLFIGSEGTLGVVTRAVLRLFPKPRSLCTALCALSDYEGVVQLLHRARAHLAGGLTAFEMMMPEFYRLATGTQSRPAPLGTDYPVYVLIEAMGSDPAHDPGHFATLVEQALEDGLVLDAMIAQSVRDSRDLWAIRDASGEFPRTFWPHTGFDVSVPTGQIGGFITDCTDRLRARWPSMVAMVYGHVADSNVHLNVKVGEAPHPDDAVEAVVYGCVRDWQGSISAEHGIGLHKKPYLGYSCSEAEIAVMKIVKAALDPAGILNPGKII